MAQFLKFVFASCLGFFLGGILLTVVGIASLAQFGSSFEKTSQKIDPNTVLQLDLNVMIPERTNNVQPDPFTFDLDNQKILGLNDIVRTIANAKEDDSIKGIFLETSGISTGLATAKVLREALVDFKESGKFIIAYSKYYSQGAYYLASTADEIYLNPMGGIDLRGFAAQVPFFKNMLDNLGIKMQIYYAGKFKSATEPYRLTKMSDENRLQTREYIEELYEIFLSGIGESRQISLGELKQIVNAYKGNDPESALEANLIDKIGYRDEALNAIRKQIGLEEEEGIPVSSLANYNLSNPPKSKFSSRNKIAVVYAEGTIVDGKGIDGSIGDDTYTKIIKKIRKDEKVKAMVLRVNSGGGSAMSSENIWREIELFKETGRPVVVSMGDYAASGGYYIACNADSILAEPNTLTGSIGVFSMIPSLQKMLDEEIGIQYDSVKTGTFSTGITPFFDISEAQGKILTESTEKVYEIFLDRVAKGRDMSPEEVHEIAQGRVWTGEKASRIGLVDKIGGLDDAVATAAGMAEIDEYRLTEYPRTKDPMQKLLEELVGLDQVSVHNALKQEMGAFYPYYKEIRELQNTKGVQARIPFTLRFE